MAGKPRKPKHEDRGNESDGPVSAALSQKLLPFSFRRLDGKILVTNEAGRFAFLKQRQFDDMLAGRLSRTAPEVFDELTAKGFLDGPGVKERLIEAMASRSTHLTSGPSLHILILTLRCNQTCRYCQASRRPMSLEGVDMSAQTAKRALDVIFQSPAPSLTIEFQGGEPLANFDRLVQVVEDARSRASRTRRRLYLSLVSNLSLMTEERLEFLLDNDVMICTSLDGPADLHDDNRPMAGSSSHAMTVEWIQRIQEAYRRRGMPDAQVNALLTVSRRTLDTDPRAILDEYVRLGLKVIHLRPLQPFGFAAKAKRDLAYPAARFLSFYRKTLEAILALNRQGVELAEKTASLFLTKMLTDRDPNYMDLRSPCGAGIGQLAYDYDGAVYPCDEARMLAAMGDDAFRLGDLDHDDYNQIINHETIRAMASASLLDGQVGCSSCAYRPYCGVCPVYSYATGGDIFGTQPNCDRCRTQMGTQDLLFRWIAEADEETLSILERWTWQRPPIETAESKTR